MNEKQERYFIVNYIGTVHSSIVTGQINMTSSNNLFLNREATTKVIIDNNQGIKEVVITSILEVSTIDWETWTYKKSES